MAWFTLLIAGVLETFAVTMINQYSMRRNWRTLFFIIFGLSFALGLLSYSLQTIPIGTGYAIWTGISVIGSSFIGMFFYGESTNWKRLVCITLILGSAIGLKLIA